jgi:hypothetical protein
MRLFDFERRWLLAVLDVLMPSGTPGGLALGARDVPLDRFLDELWAFAPRRVLLGLRATLWVLVLCPVFVLGRFALFVSLAPQEQLAVIERLRSSDSYLVRELPLLFKMVGCLGFCGMPEVQSALGAPPKSSERPSWAAGRRDER